ncbi:MAG: alpha-amylase family glycosyl hydrolase [Anaerolineales bacterium]
MADSLWWRDGVLYQIYPRSFADSSGDGIGDLPGLIGKLDHLAALGVAGLWLSPIYPSPFYDFGYDISDYENIDPIFGTLADFDMLVKEAHTRGLKVIMDLVLNHTSHLHPWFVESRSGRDDPKRDWYIWAHPGLDGGPPNNWESVFGGSAWEYDATSGQYYYHQFLKEQPDLNWRNPVVRARMWELIRFWLERGVGGFRLDAVQFLIKDEQFRDNPLTWRPDAPGLGLRAYDRQIHIYDRDRPEMMDILRDLRRVMDAYPERMTVGETDVLETAVRYVGRDKLHLAFNFDFNKAGQRELPWLPRTFQKSILKYESLLPPDGWPCYVLSNHDTVRHTTRVGGGRFSDARAKVAATLLLTQRGTPFLYYGEEIGMQQTAIPREEMQDPVGIRYWPLHPGRDGSRTPMQWDASEQAGFTTGKPWLRVNADHPRRNVAEQVNDPSSVLSVYKRLIALRNGSPALQRGSLKFLLHRPVEGMAYLREAEGQSVLIVLNFFARDLTLRLDERLPVPHWAVRFSTVAGSHARVQDAGRTVQLAPFEACILEAESDY